MKVHCLDVDNVNHSRDIAETYDVVFSNRNSEQNYQKNCGDRRRNETGVEDRSRSYLELIETDCKCHICCSS